MSNTDSFVDEVNEELSRDRLFAFFRRWGWVPLLIVVALVGGTAWREWSAAQERQAAQTAGDALIAALDAPDATARAAALAQTTDGGALRDLLAAGTLAEAGDTDAARAAYEAIATSDAEPLYKDLALFRSALLGGESARDTLQSLAVPGRPLRLLAQEQIALADLADGKDDAAIASARAILEDAEVTPLMAERMRTLLVALGASESDAGQ